MFRESFTLICLGDGRFLHIFGSCNVRKSWQRTILGWIGHYNFSKFASFLTLCASIYGVIGVMRLFFSSLGPPAIQSALPIEIGHGSKLS